MSLSVATNDINLCHVSIAWLSELLKFRGNYLHHLLHSSYTWCVQVLRSPKEAFAAAMQSWRERCEKCVCLQDDYIEK